MLWNPSTRLEKRDSCTILASGQNATWSPLKEVPTTFNLHLCKGERFLKVWCKFEVKYLLKGRKMPLFKFGWQNFFSFQFYLKLQSRQRNIYFSCFLCILFSPPHAPLFGKVFPVIRNGISLTCGSPPVQKWLTENDECKKEDTDDSYGAHKHCIHVQIWKPSTGDGQCCSWWPMMIGQKKVTSARSKQALAQKISGNSSEVV